jgi:hypothetical protein
MCCALRAAAPFSDVSASSQSSPEKPWSNGEIGSMVFQVGDYFAAA